MGRSLRCASGQTTNSPCPALSGPTGFWCFPPSISALAALFKVQYLKKYFISNADTALDVAVKTTTPERHMAVKCVGM